MKEDKRQNEIIRIQKKRNNFVMLDKGFLVDDRLSFKAKGILAYLLSKPDNWKVIVGDLIKRSKDGEKAIYSGLRELKECGYFKKIPIRDESGRRISHWESIIYECPEEPSEPDESSDENSLLAPNGKVEKTTVKSTSSLLADFVHVDNVQVQNVQVQNRQRNNNDLSNNDSNDIKSESKSDNISKSDETMTIDMENGKTKEIFENEKELPETATMTKSNGLEESSLVNAYQTQDEYIIYLKVIQENIEYNYYLHNRNEDIELVDELINCMLDVICTKGETVKINGEVKSRNMVKSQYLKLDSSDIDHIINKYKEQHHKIKHVHSYLKTMLYTIKQESDHYYTNSVRADGIV